MKTKYVLTVKRDFGKDVVYEISDKDQAEYLYYLAKSLNLEASLVEVI